VSTDSGNLNGPRISVVIPAFRRQDHIPDAIQSVLDSGVDRSLYEIVLVVDSLAPELRETLTRQGIRIFHSDTPFVGETLATGVAEARGEIVAFLDDDDCFHREKMEVLLQEFSDPKVLYFHHGFRRVHADRQPYPVRREITAVRTEFEIPLSRPASGRVRRIGGFYNTSSIALRRSALLPQLPALRRLTNAQDFSMLLLLGGRGRAIVDGTKVLVDYRTHASQGRHSFGNGEIPPEHLRYLEGTVRSFEVIRDAAPTPGAREFADCRLDSYEALTWALTGRVVSKDPHVRRRSLRARPPARRHA
jgi:glycosyltransferase involved in cell wall biosynthesis